MKRRFLALCTFLFLASQISAQQYALFGTYTSFDAFENPAQKAFVLDSSRQFASNFFLPNFGINAANKGDSNQTLRRMLSDGIYSAENLPLGTGRNNKIFENFNQYLLTFRIFKSYKYQKELGLAWQIRSDGHLNYTNETLAIHDSYKRFKDDFNYRNIFNNHGYGQSYHQFSIGYRENYNKRLAFGAKLSLLSGITYNKIDINRSNLLFDDNANSLNVNLEGTYKSSFLESEEINRRTFFPTFKNPGVSMSLGTTLTSKKGITIMGNIKDLGFIRWNKNAHDFQFNSNRTIYQLETLSSAQIENRITNLIMRNDQRKRFYTLTNAKVDLFVSKAFNFYVPGIIISKNLFYSGGDLALINSFKYNNLSISIIPDYNFHGFFMVGTQGMYKTPNFELFLGSDNLAKTIKLRQGPEASKSYNGGSFYMGLNIKFGYIVEHPSNSSYMPGLDDKETFFKRMFNIFKKEN